MKVIVIFLLSTLIWVNMNCDVLSKSLGIKGGMNFTKVQEFEDLINALR